MAKQGRTGPKGHPCQTDKEPELVLLLDKWPFQRTNEPGWERRGKGEPSLGTLSGPSFYSWWRRALGPFVLLTQKPNRLGSKVRSDGIRGGHGSCFKMHVDFIADPTGMVDNVRSSDSSAPTPGESLLVLWDRAQTPQLDRPILTKFPAI